MGSCFHTSLAPSMVTSVFSRSFRPAIFTYKPPGKSPSPGFPGPDVGYILKPPVCYTDNIMNCEHLPTVMSTPSPLQTGGGQASTTRHGSHWNVLNVRTSRPEINEKLGDPPVFGGPCRGLSGAKKDLKFRLSGAMVLEHERKDSGRRLQKRSMDKAGLPRVVFPGGTLCRHGIPLGH